MRWILKSFHARATDFGRLPNRQSRRTLTWSHVVKKQSKDKHRKQSGTTERKNKSNVQVCLKKKTAQRSFVHIYMGNIGLKSQQ